MQLALALSACITDAGLPDEQRLETRTARVQAAPSSADVQMNDEGPCWGSCLGGLSSFVGEACGRPDASEPDGGWGYTPCCGQPAHFDCLGRWLTPDDAVDESLMESRRGPEAIERKCPFCKKTLSRSRLRMLGSQRRTVRTT